MSPDARVSTHHGVREQEVAVRGDPQGGDGVGVPRHCGHHRPPPQVPRLDHVLYARRVDLCAKQ